MAHLDAFIAEREDISRQKGKELFGGIDGEVEYAEDVSLGLEIVSEGMVGRVSERCHTIFVGKVPVSKAMVEMEMGIDDIFDGKMISCYETIDGLIFGRGKHAGIYDHALGRLFVPHDEAVGGEHVELKLNDFHFLKALFNEGNTKSGKIVVYLQLIKQ